MKKHLFLWVISFLMIFKGYAQPSSAAPTPPTRSASDVISLFSGSYSDLSGTDFAPNWGQSTSVSDVTISGNTTKHYSTMNYIGVQLSGNIDVSSMQSLHLDVWTSNADSIKVSLITPGTGENAYKIVPTLSGWNSIDIALTNYTAPNLSSIGQLKFEAWPWSFADVYVDNIYFWRPAGSPSLSNFTVPSKTYGDASFTLTAPTSSSSGSFTYSSSNTSVATISGNTVTIVGIGSTSITATQAASGSYGSGSISATLVVGSPNPTSAPATPTKTAGNVISLFSNTYTNVPINTWMTSWSGCTSTTDVTVGSNTIKKYVGLNYAGIEATGSNSINATSMENFHIDAWSMDATTFKVKLVDWGANGVWGDGSGNWPGDDVEHEITYTFTPAASASGAWTSFDIPLSNFTALTTKGHISQIILSSSGSTMFFDNIYFWRTNPAPTLGIFTVPAKTLGAANFTLTPPTTNSGGTWSYSSSNTNVATISGSTVTIKGAGTSVITATQAATTTYAVGTATANLVVTGPASPLTAAPTPPTRDASDVLSLFSGAYSDVSGTDWFPNWGQNAVVQDTTIAGNLTHKYPNLNYHGVQFSSGIDASSMVNLHLDVWTASCETLDIYLINTYNGVVQKKLSVSPPFAGWQSYDLSLSQYASQGIDLANIGQMMFVSMKNGSQNNTPGATVYLDNIYFWKPSGTPVYSTFIMPTKTVGDAKFKVYQPRSTSPAAFTYSSSNTSVATVSGDSITIVGAGNTTITASQAASAPYFAGSTSAVLTVDFAPPANAAPTPPVRNTSDVISLYSNAYTNVPVDTWSASWDQANVTDSKVSNDDVKKYTNLNYSGTEFTSNTIDATSMTTFHMDIWTPNSNIFNIKLVDFGANGVWGDGFGNWPGDDVEHEIQFNATNGNAPTNNTWVSYDIPLSNFTGLTTRGHLAQLILVAGTSTVYVDNVYFYKGTALSPSISVTQPTCATATGSISITSPTTGLTFSKDGVNYISTSVFSGLSQGVYNITSKNSSGVVSSPVSATIVSTTPATNPGTIVGVKNINQCDTLQNYSVPYVYGYTYTWSVGTGNYVKYGQGTNGIVAVMKVAGTVSVTAKKCTTAGPASSISVTKAVPTTPVTKSSTGLNVCQYTASAVAITGVKDTFRIRTVSGATGYYFTVPGGSTMQRLNDTTITVVFPDTITATPAKTVKAYSLSSCDTSLALSYTLTRTAVTAPSIWAASLTNVAGVSSYTYKIRKATNALAYDWTMKVGTAASITHLNATGPNDTAVTVTYASGFTKDTISVKSVSGCGSSTAFTLPVSALAAPPTVASISGNINPCISTSTSYPYTATAGTTTSTTAPTVKFRWTIPTTATITSISGPDSATINVRFNSTYSGGSITVKGVSALGVASATAFTYTLKHLPATPTNITTSTGLYNACIGSQITDTVKTPVTTAAQATSVKFRWTWPTTASVVAISGPDSSWIKLQFNTGYNGGAVSARGVSTCGVLGTALSKTLSHTGCTTGTRLATSTTTTAEVYPNPNNGNFNININTGIDNNMPATISIIDMYGKVVAQFSAVNNFGRISKSISTVLSNGIYTVKYNVGSVTNSVRMMIQK